jgi:hypothetical protein
MARHQTNFFMRFTQGGGNRIDIAIFYATTGKAYLPGMMLECFGAPRQDHLQAGFAFNETDKYRCRPDCRAVFGDEINQFAIVPGGVNWRMSYRM